MKRLLTFAVGLVTATSIFAQSSLPACPTRADVLWTNCFGTTLTTDGSKYFGEFRDNRFHGQGTYLSLAENEFKGDAYSGEWREGKMHGKGTYTRADGTKYVGEFMDNKPNGQGTFTRADGNVYIGQFRGGKPNGQGEVAFANGEKYVGEFNDGMLHGRGIRTFVDGRLPQEGIWESDRFVRAERIPDHIAGRIATTESVKEPQLKHSVAAIESAKEKCRDLGFKLGTEKFGDCVLRLSK